MHTASPLPRVLIRVVVSPHVDSGELLAVYVDTRRRSHPDEVIYSFAREAWRVEHHRHLMWRTRRATPFEVAEARMQLELLGEKVRVLQAAPRAQDDEAEEVPASGVT